MRIAELSHNRHMQVIGAHENMKSAFRQKINLKRSQELDIQKTAEARAIFKTISKEQTDQLAIQQFAQKQELANNTNNIIDSRVMLNSSMELMQEKTLIQEKQQRLVQLQQLGKIPKR